MNETWVTMVGNVATDVSWRRTPNGGEVAKFCLISSERRLDAESGMWEDGNRVVAWVSCWRRLGDNVRVCVTKGDPVIVRGKLSTREFETDGVRRSTTEIDARTVGLDLGRVRAKVVAAPPAATERPVTDVTDLVVVGEDEPPAGPDDLGDGSPVGAPLAGSVVGERDEREEDGAELVGGPALAG